MTLKADGPLAQSLPTSFVATTGQGSQIVLQLVALAVLKRQGLDVSLMSSALSATPKALYEALESFEPQAAAIASAMKDVPVTNVLASGPLQGAAETFTMCYLQEMQWMHAATINADEFFQGPFEVIDKTTKSIVFLGEDNTRPMGEGSARSSTRTAAKPSTSTEGSLNYQAWRSRNAATCCLLSSTPSLHASQRTTRR